MEQYAIFFVIVMVIYWITFLFSVFLDKLIPRSTVTPPTSKDKQAVAVISIVMALLLSGGIYAVQETIDIWNGNLSLLILCYIAGGFISTMGECYARGEGNSYYPGIIKAMIIAPLILWAFLMTLVLIF